MIRPIGDDGVVVPAAMSETLNVRADLNGMATVCVYDTGSSFSLLLSQSDADNLNLPHGDTVGLGTASGTAAGYRTSVCVTVAGRTIQVDDAVVAPTHTWFPLIGVPLARKIGRITTIDWEANEVEFDPTPDVRTIAIDVSAQEKPADYEIVSVGSKWMDVDESSAEMDAPAMMIRKRGEANAWTMVPLRAPFEAKGCLVTWDGEKWRATVTG